MMLGHRFILCFDPKVIGCLKSFRGVHLRCGASGGYFKTPKGPVILPSTPCCPQLKNATFSNTSSVFNKFESKLFIGSKSNSKVCWNCNKLKDDKGPSPSPFCVYCNSLQPLDREKDFFNIFGIVQSFKIQQSELKKRYRDLQTLLHPDKFSTRPKREQEISDEFSSAVNKAYNTLLNPLERGLYLLSLHNVTIEEGSTNIDKVFLMEIMERNEDIESEADSIKLKQYYSNNRERIEDLISKVADAFESKDYQLAKELLTKMKYYNSIEVKIKEIRQKLNIPD